LNRYLILIVLLVSACSRAEPAAKTTSPPSEQPTLSWNDIPELEASPPPPLPLLLTDSRYPIGPASGTDYEAGKQLYESYCAACHGINGEGQRPDPYAPGAAPPHNADGHTWHHPDQQNFQTVWQGLQVNGVMPSFADRLTAGEIIQILAYLKTWWEPHQLEQQMEMSRRIAEQ
jgi:mono/diheme cytochrome c family protein